MPPAQLAGRIVAVAVMVAAVVGAVVDSAYWLTFGAAVAWPFWAHGRPPD